jgi:chromosome segregation ATPase
MGIGIGIYFFTRNTSSNQQTPTTQERVQQLQNQLVQIETALTTLTNNITQTETTLQTKRTEYQQSQADSLQTEINQLESQLTTYKTQKQKIETLLPQIKTQIDNLGQGENNTDSKKSEIIKNLEKDIQQINKELGIKVDEPTPRKLPDDKKDPDLPNSTLQDLLADLKIVEDYLIECNKHNEANPNNPNYQLDKNKYSFGLDDIKNIKKIMKFSSPTQDEIIETRKEFREK